MRGGLAETWVMAWAKRARTAETPKQPSLCLMLRAPYIYPTERPTRLRIWEGVSPSAVSCPWTDG